ncbi:MAG: hypothetical protein IJ306_03525 [Oscillospiraceae bacterium]|nr:hypothetical protein [Oscillospiraceae bacterium]
MSAEGVLLFVLIIGGSVAAIGFALEFFTCRAKNGAVKFILPAVCALLFLACGLITEDFTGGSAALFGLLAISAAVMLLINLIFKRR